MKKRILSAALLSACVLASCAKQGALPAGQTADADLLRTLSGSTQDSFRPTELTPELEAACAAAIGKMKLVRNVNAEPANTMSAAQKLILRNISVTVTPSSRTCVEYEEWFLISGLNTAGKDDGSFKSGIAVKKGTAQIYEWK